MYNQPPGGANLFKTAGTLEEWQNNIGRLAAGNSRISFSISCAFAGPLLPLLGIAGGGGFHLRGATSLGKSTALRVAGSVVGGSGRDGFLRTWRATANGFEGVAMGHNHTLLCLDEMGQADPREIGEVAYMLANGLGKQRMNRNISMRRAAEWQLLYLSSGEVGLGDYTKTIDKPIKGGQEVRLIDLPADAGRGMGLFESLHHFTTAKEFADHLLQSAVTYYGTPLRAFLRQLTADRRTLTERVRILQSEFVRSNVKADSAAEVGRAASRFGLVAASGEIAAGMGITTWAEGEATHGARECFRAWLTGRGGSGAADAESGVRRVRLFIEQHGASRFEMPIVGIAAGYDDAPPPRIFNRAGFVRANRNTGKREYIFLSETWRTEVCNGYDPAAVARALKDRAYLETDDGHLTVKRTVGEVTGRFYVVKSGILDPV